jgi:hypothetical protein
LGRSEGVDLVAALNVCFGVSERAGETLLQNGLVLIDGETVGKRERVLPLSALRGRTLQIRGTEQRAAPWGLPVQAPPPDSRPSDQLQLVE